MSAPRPADARALKAIADRFGLDLIVLFGSFAKGRARPDSDMDIAVLRRRGSPRPPPRQDMDLTEALGGAVEAPEGVDVVGLDTAPPLLQFEVARSGIPLFERTPGRFLQFRVYAARRFDDNRKFFDATDRYLLTHGEK